jgi:hypothetical protein
VRTPIQVRVSLVVLILRAGPEHEMLDRSGQNKHEEALGGEVSVE